MKLLLDENLPKRLKQDFNQHEVFTVRDKGWNGIKNGDLLNLMMKEGFDALLTFDKNLQHQQNFEKYSICVFVLVAKNNIYSELTSLSPAVLDRLESADLPKGPVIVSNSPAGG
jgi:hypothetical protein